MSTSGPTTELGHAGGFVPSWNELSGGDNEVGALRWPMSVHTYHKMRVDSQIDALLRSVTLPIRRYSWHLKAHGARPEVVEHVAADLGVSIEGEEDPPRTRKRFSHDDHLRHALLGPVYGHMFFEQVGRVDDDLRWRLSKLAPRMPQSITEIKVADDGGLVHIKQNAKVSNVYGGQKIDIDRLVAYVWEREGGNWTGRSMLRPLYSHYLIKDRLLRIDALKNERFGLGIPTGTAPPGGDPGEYARMAQSIQAGPDTGVGLPAGARLGVEGITGSLPDTIGSIRYHDEQMARTFLAMFMQLGQTQTGSRALGDSFVDFFELSLEALANWYADITNQHVIEDIVDWNYGEDEEAPELVWAKDDAQQLGVDEMGALIEMGILAVDEEIQHWVRERYRLPPPAEGSSGAPAQSDDAPLEDWARDADGLPPSADEAGEVAARRVRAHLPGKHDQRDHGRGTSNIMFANQAEWDATLAQANEKIAAAPVPNEKAVTKARADLENSTRAGGDSRGGSAADRRRQRENLFNEFDPEGKGYVVCHLTGMKLHWSPDPEINPEGFPLLERGKIFTKEQGGAYRLTNLLPESYLGNRSRGDEPVRMENLA